ncbi:MAG: tetratricopeptide repeat protein [Phycisphaerales bacterium]|nr:tetratricopeptide repeat protein [Phycisphaerales bacterium]
MSRLAQLQSLLAADPADPFLLYGLAQEYAKLNDHSRAIEFYNRCLAADPAYGYAYYHKARAQLAAGDAAAARATLATGLAAARASRDSHALSELQALLDDLD